MDRIKVLKRNKILSILLVANICHFYDLNRQLLGIPYLIKVYPLTDIFVYADPYLNTDAGTMSPIEHGEVFVLDDGGEVIMGWETESQNFKVKWS